MINPSIHGWIDKFFALQSQTAYTVIENSNDFYIKTRKTGFIFGHILDFDAPTQIDHKNRLAKEITKIGMLNTLYQMYRLTAKDDNPSHFIEQAVAFYDILTPKGFNPLDKMLPSTSVSHKLEKIIHDRVQTNEDIFSKSFSHVVTNALLFIDVLAFRQFLDKKNIDEKYFSRIEDTVINVISLSLKTKTNISVHDNLLLKLFESSVRYNKFSNVRSRTLDTIDFSYLTDNLEKYYVIDLAGISLWSDEKVENEERYFLFKLGEKLDVEHNFVQKSIDFINHFISSHKSKIPYFKNANPVKTFYDQTTESVIILINRNKNRLLKEITESKELMQLLAKSTHKDLDKDEKRKMKKQLLDICKSIPSLTIFLLPGGSLLLPILIKFIPKMLPSAFNENTDSIN